MNITLTLQQWQNNHAVITLIYLLRTARTVHTIFKAVLYTLLLNKLIQIAFGKLFQKMEMETGNMQVSYQVEHTTSLRAITYAESSSSSSSWIQTRRILHSNILFNIQQLKVLVTETICMLPVDSNQLHTTFMTRVDANLYAFVLLYVLEHLVLTRPKMAAMSLPVEIQKSGNEMK